MIFHQLVRKAIEDVFQYAKNNKKQFVTPEHMLKIILEQYPGIYDGVDEKTIIKSLEDYITKYIPNIPPEEKKEPIESAAFRAMMNKSAQCAMNAGKDELDIADVLAGIWNTKCQAGAILKAYRISKENTILAAQKLKEKSTLEKGGYLATFCKELVSEAKAGKFDPIIGRDSEIERTIEILCRKKKNNPLHRGNSGTGKTSITIGLAMRIANEEVPDILKGYEIWSVDLGGMLAGCKYRGEFEQRIDGIIKETLNKPKSILYIDEIHNLVGAGNGGSGGSLDAANMFRPYLSSGEIRVIGATTFEDYKKSFEGDGALSRRFQNIDILAPSEKETYEILLGLKVNYEKYHNVEYPDEILTLIAHLSGTYIHERSMPDSAIDVLDEVGAKLRVRNFKEGEKKDAIIVTEEMVEAVVSKIAKVPPKSVSKDDGSKLMVIKDDLQKVIFGQDEAIDKLVMATKRARAGFRKTKKPIANLIFAGRSGTGKTELSQQFANLMGMKLIRWDMSEMTEKNSVSKWIGTSAGYIGYEEGGRLVDQIRKTPNCVLLLDEIEKASPDVFNVLLGIMDNAELSDSHGQTADFTNVILIMTSNVGAARIGEKTIGFEENIVKGKTNIDAIKQEYDKMFSPEFRNRVDTLVIFNDLSDENLKRIVSREIEDFKTQLSDKNIDIELDEDSINWLVKNGYDEKMGARPLVRLFEKEVKDQIVDTVLFGDLKNGGKASYYVDNDHLNFTTEHIDFIEKKEEEEIIK